MPLTLSSLIQASIKILVGTDSTFSNRLYDDLLDIDQTTELIHNYTSIFEGQQTDKAIDFGDVVSPTFIFIIFNSRSTGTGAPADGTHQPTLVKIEGSTAFDSDTILLYTSDPLIDTLPNTIIFSTLADTNTEVTVLIGGRKA